MPPISIQERRDELCRGQFVRRIRKVTGKDMTVVLRLHQLFV
jgi:hypothetical protein